MSNSERIRVVILISGSGTNLQAIIDAQAKGELDINIVGVVSDRPDVLDHGRLADLRVGVGQVEVVAFLLEAGGDPKQVESRLL